MFRNGKIRLKLVKRLSFKSQCLVLENDSKYKINFFKEMYVKMVLEIALQSYKSLENALYSVDCHL